MLRFRMGFAKQRVSGLVVDIAADEQLDSAIPRKRIAERFGKGGRTADADIALGDDRNARFRDGGFASPLDASVDGKPYAPFLVCRVGCANAGDRHVGASLAAEIDVGNKEVLAYRIAFHSSRAYRLGKNKRERPFRIGRHVHAVMHGEGVRDLGYFQDVSLLYEQANLHNTWRCAV